MGKAQVSLEYLILTAFILVIVIIIFALSLFNYDANVRLTKVGNSVDSLVKTADLVYSRGYGTALYATTSWPNGVKSISIINKCKDDLVGCPGGQTTDMDSICLCDTLICPDPCPSPKCTKSYDCIKYSAVHVVMDDGTDFLYPSKAKLCLRYQDAGWKCDAINTPADAFPLSAVELKVKALWVTNVSNEDYIALQGIPD